MRNQWSPEEEEAVRSGVVKYGEGKWMAIKADPSYNHELRFRSNVDIKDKWRVMQAADAYADKPRALGRVEEGPRVVGGGVVTVVRDGRPEGWRR